MYYAGYLSLLRSSKTDFLRNWLDSKGINGPRTFQVSSEKNQLGIRSSIRPDFVKIKKDQVNNVVVLIDGDIFDIDESVPEKIRKETVSDPELILQLYGIYGNRFCELIDGSYAIVLYDGAKDQLLLIRDRFGTKPLFFRHEKEAFFFSSRVKNLVEMAQGEARVHLDAINLFLSYGYIPNPATMFEDIKQVKPGYRIVIRNGMAIEESYWTFVYGPVEAKYSEGEYVEEFWSLFKNSVSKRLQRKPEAGAFLSGGLDTSGTVAVMQELKGEGFKVFTAGFRENAYNEIGDAESLCAKLGLDSFSVLIDYEKNFGELLERLVLYHDAPFHDTSAIPTYYVAKLAGEHVRDVFTGDFPDQLIGGSTHHIQTLNWKENDNIWKKVMRSKHLNDLAVLWAPSAGTPSLTNKIKRALYNITFPYEEKMIICNMPVPPLLKNYIYGKKMRGINRNCDPLDIARQCYGEVERESLLNKILYFDMAFFAPDDLMVKVNRMCSANQVNAFSPYHDKKLVEFVGKIPENMKVCGSETKYILREALRPLVSKELLRREKKGFGMPIEDWLRRFLHQYVRDLLFDSKSLNRGYFDKKALKNVVEGFLSGNTDYATGSHSTIVSLITLEIWHRLFVDR